MNVFIALKGSHFWFYMAWSATWYGPAGLPWYMVWPAHPCSLISTFVVRKRGYHLSRRTFPYWNMKYGKIPMLCLGWESFSLEECLAWINITLAINMGMFQWFCFRLSEPMGIFFLYWNSGFVFCSTWYVSISFHVSQFIETTHVTFIFYVGISLRFCLHKQKFNLNLMTFPYWSIIVFCKRWDNSYVSHSVEKIHIPFMWKSGIFYIRKSLIWTLMTFPYWSIG